MNILFDNNNLPYIDLGNNYSIRLESEPLTDASKEIAEIELRETAENIKEGLKELRVLLKGRWYYKIYIWIYCEISF